jgi:hypothetical protein
LSSIETHFVEERRYAPDPAFAAQANARPELYEEGFEAFWEREGRERVTWAEPFGELYEWELPYAKWYLGGKLNVSSNCVDRHVEAGHGDRVAYHWEGEPGDRRTITYADLLGDVVTCANALKELGVGKGTKVAIYMGMVPELPIAMLACTRLGAPHTVVFGVHRLGRARLGLIGDELVPPHISALHPFDRALFLANTLQHDHLFDEAGFRERVVHVLLQRDDIPASESAIGGDDDARLGILDPINDRLAGKSAEDYRVRRAYPGAGEHCDGGFGDHRHVDGDAIAFLDAEGLQAVGEFAHIVQERAIGDAVNRSAAARAARFRLAFPEDRGFVATTELNLPIKAVIADVGFAADEPLGIRRLPVEHLVPFLEPMEFIRNA